MSDDSSVNWDALISGITSGYIGYVAGSRRFTAWEPIIKGYDNRMTYLAFVRVIRPLSFFNAIPNAEIIYGEAIQAYLFGLPDASIPTTIRCMEMGIAKKFTDTMGKPRPERLFDLINWAEHYLGNRKETAHGFRILRNLVHEQSVLSEQDAVEALRHITIFLNLLYPPLMSLVTTNYNCQSCKRPLQTNVPILENYLGNIIKRNCPYCSQLTSVLIL